jgi:hypothetical protein
MPYLCHCVAAGARDRPVLLQGVLWRIGDPVDALQLPPTDTLDSVVLRLPAVMLRLPATPTHLAPQRRTSSLELSADMSCDPADAGHLEYGAADAARGVRADVGFRGRACEVCELELLAPSGALMVRQVLAGVERLVGLDGRREGWVQVLDGLQKVSTAGRLPVVYEVSLIR